MNKIYCFGDSWAAGAELDHSKEFPFIHWLAKSNDSEYVNYGMEGASLGIILHTLVMHYEEITRDDKVIIIIPPDVRWYDENAEKGFYSLMQWMKEDYMKSLNNKTVEWFKYHHLMFIYTMQKMLDEKGCKYVLAHNYGQLPTNDVYNFPINYSKFLSQTSLLNLLSNNADWWESYQFDTDGPMYIHSWHGKYFEGMVCHPNELGHKRIAEMLLEYFNE